MSEGITLNEMRPQPPRAETKKEKQKRKARNKAKKIQKYALKGYEAMLMNPNLSITPNEVAGAAAASAQKLYSALGKILEDEQT